MFTPHNPNPKAIDRVTDKFPIPTTCPHCNGAVEIASNAAIYNGREYGDWPWIYLCVNKKCFASIGMHPETNLPLGTLAHGPLRQQRMKAKSLFNPLWQSGKMARKYAYYWLAKEMGLPPEQCHFGLFDEKQCELAMKVITTRKLPTQQVVQPDWKKKLQQAKVTAKHTFQSFMKAKKL